MKRKLFALMLALVLISSNAFAMGKKPKVPNPDCKDFYAETVKAHNLYTPGFEACIAKYPVNFGGVNPNTNNSAPDLNAANRQACTDAYTKEQWAQVGTYQAQVIEKNATACK